MAAFLSGSAIDCGPSNVLKNVGGRIDRDVGLQQDRLVSAQAGPSRRIFNSSSSSTQQAHIPVSASRQVNPSTTAFDLSSLRTHLAPSAATSPPPQAYVDRQWAETYRPTAVAGPSRQVNNGQRVEAGRSAWAATFDPSAPQKAQKNVQKEVMAPWQRPVDSTSQYLSPLQTLPYPSYAHSITYHHYQHTQPYMPPPQAQYNPSQRHDNANQDISAWPSASDFDTYSETTPSQQVREPTIEEEPLPEVDWKEDAPSDLASVLSIPPTVPEVLPLRPGATAATIPRQAYSYHDQSNLLMSDHQPQLAPLSGGKSVHFQSSGVPSSLEEALAHSTSIPGATTSWEDPLVTDLSDFDEDAFMMFNGEQRVATDGRIGVGDMESWGEMQNDWEELQRGLPRSQLEERGAEGRYLFQTRNPYAAEEMGMSDRAQGRESPTVKGILELEAAVQADPTDHHAWYALGLKQQENERESAAILALSKVTQLDPDYRPTYLALAVSYTNEGEYGHANAMISKWIDLAPVSSQLSAGIRQGLEEGTGWKEAQKILVDRLIGLARMNPNPDELDPDVQVALGVLFNTSEEYEKAEDCLQAALSVRPNDWLLYNRLGATLANSGRSNEALEYYAKALSLHPNFIRALFNMGISYINLSQYALAAQSVLDALRLQQADATEGYASGTVGNAAKGVTSETLWQTLRSACMHMGRNDLVALATKKDLAAFPADLSIRAQA